MTSPTRVALGALLTLVLASGASAATGSPDCYGYTWNDDDSGCTLSIPTFSAAAQTFNTANSMQGPFALQFPFIYYGAIYNQVFVSPAGFVTFLPGQATGMAGGVAMPDPASPNAVIAANWMPTANADITIESTASFFHVRWRQRRTAGAALLAEARLILNPDGSFRVTWPIALDIDVVTVGHENAAGDCGRTPYRNFVAESGPGGSFPFPSNTNSACFVPPSLLDCSTPVVASCGDSLASTLPASLARSASVYSCQPGLFQGNEEVFSLTVPAVTQATVSIDNAGLTLFEVGACDERSCLRLGPQRLDYPVLFPGTYLYVVDKPALGGGDAFTFNVSCATPYQDLRCGDTVSGATAGATGIRDYHSCAGTLTGPEKLYRVSLATDEALSVVLDSANPDLWVAIYDAATFESGATTCRAAGRGGAGLFTATAGDYVIVVDGANGASGAYDLTVTCGLQLDCATAVNAACGEVVNGTTADTPNTVALYSCSTEALPTGEDIYSFFNPTEQAITARFVTSQPGQRLLLFSRCKEDACTLASDEGVACALFPRGQYYLVVDGTAGSEGAYSFAITCSDFSTGIDLAVTALDASPLVTSCQSFDVSGTVTVAVTNLGSVDAPGPVDVVVFEDATGTPPVDHDAGDDTLGTASLAAGVRAGETVFVSVPTNGTLNFRDNTIFAKVDPSNAVAESREDDNLLDTGRSCEYRPPSGVFTPIIEWDWGPANAVTSPTFYEVDTNPLVGDVNLDGIPDIVFVAGVRQFDDGIIRVISGRDGSPIWSGDDPALHVWSSTNIALGDIDGVPGPEIIGQSFQDLSRLVALSSNGTLLWQSQPFLDHPVTTRGTAGGGGAPSIADIDNDGLPEIVYGANAFRADGSYFWTPQAGGTRGINYAGRPTQDGAISVVADVNLDGKQEVVAGPTAYEWDPLTGTGRILWNNPAVPDGYPAVGNFDVDDTPEIAITANGTIYLLEGDTGALIWQRQIPRGGGGCGVTAVDGGPPTVADFDGDCASEVGAAGADLYTVFETDGTVKWSAPINDCSSHRTASSVFDFEGDGAAEVAFMDQTLLHVFQGTTGFEIASVPTASHTWTEMIAIADVDADNNAEIIMPMNADTPGGLNGIRVIGDADDNWVNTRRIWNQHQYHITNVNDDGSIPGPFTGGAEKASWREHGTYRDQLGSGIYTAADLTVSIIETRLELDAACQPQLTIVARVGNGGGIPPGRTTELNIFGIDRGTGSRTDLGTATVPDLAPGEPMSPDFTLTVPFLLLDVVDIHAFVDEAFLVQECREDNNECVVTVDGSAPEGSTPGPVGPALRACCHGPVGDPMITTTWNWTLDASAPRPPEHHFDIFRGERPDNLTLVSAPDHPWTSPTWTDSTPRSAGRHCWYYEVLAANACEYRSAD